MGVDIPPQGCYNDNVGSRTLGGSYYGDNTNMNASACIAFCQKKGTVYAGTEYSSECYCGNILAAAATLQSDSSCNMGCTANASEACGGPDMVTVYYANTPAPAGPFTNSGPAGWASQGCWTDGQPRTLANTVDVAGGGSNMTVAGCTAACKAGGWSLAGVEYAGEWSVSGLCLSDSARTLIQKIAIATTTCLRKRPILPSQTVTCHVTAMQPSSVAPGTA